MINGFSIGFLWILSAILASVGTFLVIDNKLGDFSGVNDFSPFMIRNYSLTDGTSTTTAATLRNNNWYVGIGTTTPESKLTVAGEIRGSYYTATSTATSTFTGGVFANTFRGNLPSCDSLDTDSTGAIICGTDATGAAGGGPGLVVESVSDTKYNTASTSGRAFLFKDGFVSSGASSSISDTVSFTASATTTFTGGVFADAFRTNFPSCSEALETDSTGAIVCGTDASGGGTGGANITVASSIISLDSILYSMGDIFATTSGSSLYASSTVQATGNIIGYGLFDIRGVGTSTVLNNLSAEKLTSFSVLKVGDTATTTISGSATSTFGGGIFANALRFNQPSCTNELETDSTGAIICGSQDVTGDWTGTLDSIEGANFLRSDVADTAGGLITLSAGFFGSSTIHMDSATTTELGINDKLYSSFTGTSTFDGGIFANALRTNLPSCDTLDTNSSGAIICGTDATGAGGSGQIDFELFNNVGHRATTTGKYLFVRGDLTATSSQARFEVAGDAHIHDLLTVGYITATGTATSTFTGGISADSFDTNLPSCTEALETDSTGAIICGTDAISGTAGANITITGGVTSLDTILFSMGDIFATTTGASVYASSTVQATGNIIGYSLLDIRGAGTSTFAGNVSAEKLTSYSILKVGNTATTTISGSGTSTFPSGILISGGGIDLDLPSCTGELETDSLGAIVCGTQDVTGDWTGTIDGNNFAGGAIGIGELLYGGSAGSFSELAAGTRGNVLMFGTGALPIWQSTSTLAWESDTATSTFTSGISMNHLTVTEAITSSGGGTSTFTGGIFANTFRTNLPSCDSLDTDSTGALVCGVDADTTYTAGNNLTLTGTDFDVKASLFSMGDIFATTTSASIYASSTVQATGNILGYLDVLFGGTTTPWGGVNVEQQAGKGYLKPVFQVGDTGTSSPHMQINQKGQLILATTSIALSGANQSNATSTRGAIMTPYLVVDGSHNGTTTIQIGDVGNPACLKIRDADNGGWSYCRTESGVFTCSTVSC